MGKIHIVIPDAHATPGTSNRRAEWIGKLISELKPDVVIDLGDTADMSSLCSYDRNTRSFHGRTYEKDINAHADYQERLWRTVRRSKRKLPRRVRLIGNHDYRITKAIELSPELEGAISLRDLDLDKYYQDVVNYEGSTPGTIDIDGITYAHYLTSGVLGRPISGEHLAHSLLTKKFKSCTVGHNHTYDFCIRTSANRKKIMGLCAGVFQEHFSSYAGEANHLWHKGVVIKRDVTDGTYDHEWVSMNRLRRLYG